MTSGGNRPSPHGAGYTRGFYDAFSSGSRSSAQTVVPIVLDLVGGVRSVLDVGCGIGTWLSAFAEHGVGDLLGVDGEYVDRSQLLVPAEWFAAHDLSVPLALGRTFDLVTSLEVAEHLESSTAGTFVGSLCAHASEAVLFSAAAPGQGGRHHVNEQWPSYWVRLFSAHGFEPFDVVRPRIWDDQSVEWWYRQNTLLFACGEVAGRLRALDDVRLVDVVHPAGARRSARDVVWDALPDRVTVVLRRANALRRGRSGAGPTASGET